MPTNPLAQKERAEREAEREAQRAADNIRRLEELDILEKLLATGSTWPTVEFTLKGSELAALINVLLESAKQGSFNSYSLLIKQRDDAREAGVKAK